MSALNGFIAQYTARPFSRPESVVRIAYNALLSSLRQCPSTIHPLTLDGASTDWIVWFESMDYTYEQFVGFFRTPKNFRRLRFYTGADLVTADYHSIRIWEDISRVAKSHSESIFPKLGETTSHRPSSGSSDSSPEVAPAPSSLNPPIPFGLGSGSSSQPAPSVPPVKRSRGTARASRGRSKDKGKESVSTRPFLPLTKVNCDDEVFVLDLLPTGNPSRFIGSDRRDYQCDTCYVRGLYCEPSGGGKKCAFCRARAMPCSGTPTRPYTGPPKFSPVNFFPALMRHEFPFHYLSHGLGPLDSRSVIPPATSSVVSPFVNVSVASSVAATAANLADVARTASQAVAEFASHPYLAHLVASHRPPSVSVPVNPDSDIEIA